MYFEVNDTEPIYIQIIRHIKLNIIKGNLEEGDSIPSRRELAQILKVNANTVQRAYREMESMGIIETVRNFQSTITYNNEILEKIKLEMINESIDKFLSDMKNLNFSKQDIIEMIEKNIENTHKF